MTENQELGELVERVKSGEAEEEISEAPQKAAAASAKKKGVVGKIIAATLAVVLLFSGGILITSANARKTVSRFIENTPGIGNLDSKSVLDSTKNGSGNQEDGSSDLTEEQLNLYRQYLLRGNILKGYMKDYNNLNIDESKIRYRFYDIDKDGINDLYFVTPSEVDTEEVVIGKLLLDKDGRIIQSLKIYPKDSNEMIGVLRIDGKIMEAEYDDSVTKYWSFYDPNGDKRWGSPGVFPCVAGFGYGYDGSYDEQIDNEHQITEEEFPKFFQQVEMIVGTGLMFDSYDGTISYQELVGNEILNPEFIEYFVEIDGKQNPQFPYSRTLNYYRDGVPNTLPFADDAVLHPFGSDSFGFYSAATYSLDEFIEKNALLPARAYVQIANGEIAEMWYSPILWGGIIYD